MAMVSSSNAQLKQPCYLSDRRLNIGTCNQLMAYFEHQHTVYLFGGHFKTHGDSYNTIYKWDVSNHSDWFQLMPTISTPTVNFWSYTNDIVVINELAYFIGVYDGAYDGNIYIFDSTTETFTDTTDLSKPHFHTAHGCLVTNNTHIFMVGGYTGSMWPNYLQIYNIDINEWYSEVITLTLINGGWARQYCYMRKNSLFVFGGQSSSNNYEILNEYYKWEWQIGWIYLGRMDRTLCSGAVAVYTDHLFLVGGGDGQIAVSDIRTFSMDQENITSLYYMTQSLSGLSSLVIDGKLYVFGGYTNGYGVTDVQICDILITGTDENVFEMIVKIGVMIALAGLIMCAFIIVIVKKKKKSALRHQTESLTVNSPPRRLSAMIGK
eukprot:287518_1